MTRKNKRVQVKCGNSAVLRASLYVPRPSIAIVEQKRGLTWSMLGPLDRTTTETE